MLLFQLPKLQLDHISFHSEQGGGGQGHNKGDNSLPCNLPTEKSVKGVRRSLPKQSITSTDNISLTALRPWFSTTAIYYSHLKSLKYMATEAHTWGPPHPDCLKVECGHWPF